MTTPRTIVAALAAFLLSACALFSGVRTDEGVDLGALADKVALVRQDVTDLAMLAEPATQVRIQKLVDEAGKVEAALRVAASGGPISDVQTAAAAAFALADSVLAEMKANGEDVGNLPLYVGLGKIVFRHLSLGEVEEAADALKEPAEEPPSK